VPLGLPDPKELGFYFSLSQVGLEMVVPVGVGLFLDHYFEWKTPWGAIAGAVLGLVVGFVHLVALVNQHDKEGPGKPRQDSP
jgi:F0F1-type ATP synthase assembly protein I